MRIKDNTRGVLREIDLKAEIALLKAGRMVESTAKRLVVVVTGKTQASITTQHEKRKETIGSLLEHVPRLEIAKPFLRPALHANLENIRRLFK